MATKKASKKVAPAKAAKAEKAAKPEGMKYGIKDLAALLKIEPASARVRLRKHEIEKVGGRYGWNTKNELEAVAKQLEAEAPEEDEEDEEEEEETEDEEEEEDD